MSMRSTLSLLYGERITVEMLDSTIYTGTVDRVNNDHFILDEEAAFGDMLVLYYKEIKHIHSRR